MFPAHPSIGEQFIGTKNRVFEWDGDKWKKGKPLPPEVATPVIAPVISDFWPSDPIPGEQVADSVGRTWQWDGEKWIGLSWVAREIEGPSGPPGPPGPGFVDFSYAEQDTGLLWVDGRKIYQKVIDAGHLPGPSEFIRVPHGIEGLYQFTESYGIGIHDAYAYQFPFPFLDPSPSGNSVAFWMDPTHLTIQTGGSFDRSDVSTKFLLRYTCTDR